MTLIILIKVLRKCSVWLYYNRNVKFSWWGMVPTRSLIQFSFHFMWLKPQRKERWRTGSGWIWANQVSSGLCDSGFILYRGTFESPGYICSVELSVEMTPCTHWLTKLFKCSRHNFHKCLKSNKNKRSEGKELSSLLDEKNFCSTAEIC